MFNINVYILLVIMAVLVVFIDSVLGSKLQVLYKCANCNQLTERKLHCNTATVYYKGVKWIDNSMVNFLSGVISCLITLGVLYIFGI